MANATTGAGAAAANDAGDLPAEREASRAIEAPTRLAADHEADLAFEREIERELKRWADLSAERKAVFAAKRSTDCHLSIDISMNMAVEPAVRRETSPPRERGFRGAAILTALALTAAAIVILTLPGLAVGPVSATREPVLSASPYTGVSDREPARAGARPLAAPPAERIAPRAAAPAQVAGEPAPAAPAVDAEALCVEDIAEAAPPASPVSPSETMSDAEPVPNDRSGEDRALVPAGEDPDRPASAIAVETEPAAEAAPEPTAEAAPEPTAEAAPEPAAEAPLEPTAEAAPAAPTSAPLLRKRPPRGRAQQRVKRDADDALAGAQVIPTARDLVDAPADVAASSPETPPDQAPPAE